MLFSGMILTHASLRIFSKLASGERATLEDIYPRRSEGYYISKSRCISINTVASNANMTDSLMAKRINIF